MAFQLQEQCSKNTDYVLGLVGADHYDVASHLRLAGLKVQEFYITESPIQASSQELGDLCIRNLSSSKEICKDYPTFQGTVYDLYSNPGLNPYNDIINQILVTDQHHLEL